MLSTLLLYIFTHVVCGSDTHKILSLSRTAHHTPTLNSAAFGKFDEGKEMAKTVERLLSKPGMQRIKSRSFYILEAFIRHWTCPIHASRDPLLQGYQIGLETGDVESAALNSE